MVLLLVYQMTKRIINQWNNWIIITIIWEPPWTVCDEAEPCNFLLFEVTICHDPVYHPHTSCHLMTPGYCLTSVRQSAAPQHTGDHCDSLSDTDTHHTTTMAPSLGTWRRFLFLCVEDLETACGFIWYLLVMICSHAVSNVRFRFSYFGNWTLIIKPKMARWGIGFSWQEQQWPSIWFLNLVRQSGG